MGANSFRFHCDSSLSELKRIVYSITRGGSSLVSLSVELPHKLFDSTTRIELIEEDTESLLEVEQVAIRALVYYLGFQFIYTD